MTIAIQFAETGKRPTWPCKQRRNREGRGDDRKLPKYQRFSPLVARLRDEDHKTFPQIAAYIKNQFGIGIAGSTLTRAYDYAHPDAVAAATEKTSTPERGRGCRIGEEKFRNIRRLDGKGVSADEIAKTVGCGVSTVYRERKKLTKELEG